MATGYSLRYVGDVERGTKSATLRTMNDMATLFDIPVSALIREAEALSMSKKRESTTPLPGQRRSLKR